MTLRVLGFDGEWNDSRYPFATWTLACTYTPDRGMDPGSEEWWEVERREAGDQTMYSVGRDVVDQANALDGLVAHNASADIKALHIDVESIKVPIYDTLVLSWLLDENGEHGLKALSPMWLDGRVLEDPIVVRDSGKEPDYTVYWRETGNRVDDPKNLGEVLKYCMEDTRATHDLFFKLWDALPKHLQEWYLEIEEPFLRSLIKTEQLGVRIDEEKLAQATADCTILRDKREQALYDCIGYEFNVNSPKQMANVFYQDTWYVPERQVVGVLKSCIHKKPVEKCKEPDCPGWRPKYGWVDVPRKGLGLKVRRWTKAPKGKSEEEFEPQPSTDKMALEMLDHELADKVLEYRQIEKVLGTYLLAIPRRLINGRLYCHFNPAGTRTGRLSSSKLNLQNIPAHGELGKLVRSMFIAREGYELVIYDYDAIEFRVLVDLANVNKMLQEFIAAHKEGRKADPHLVTAQVLYAKQVIEEAERDLAKKLNYASIYGAGAGRFAREAKIALAQAKAFLKKFWAEVLPQVPKWKQDVYTEAKQKGYIELPSGRRRRVYDIFHHDPGMVSYAERQLISGRVQGTAGDIIKLATVYIYRVTGLVALLHVHDEQVFEVPKDSEETDLLVYTIPEAADWARQRLGLRVPVTCEVKRSQSWAGKKG